MKLRCVLSAVIGGDWPVRPPRSPTFTFTSNTAVATHGQVLHTAAATHGQALHTAAAQHGGH